MEGHVDPAAAALARKVAEALEAGGIGLLGEYERVIIYRVLRDAMDPRARDRQSQAPDKGGLMERMRLTGKRKPKPYAHLPEDLRSPFIEFVPDARDDRARFMVWMPPRGPQDYEGGDVNEGALLGPYGETFWATKYDAEAFFEQVRQEERLHG